jgi:hypothetical protein
VQGRRIPGPPRRELDLGLSERADKVLAAHNDLYVAGSRLSL